MSFLELAKQAIEGTKQRSDADYHARVEAALQAVCRPDYPVGMIPWLGEAHPDLYDELTRRIPDEINLAWKCQAPLAEFDAILARLVETHRRACELYRERSRKGADTVLGSRQRGEQAK